MLSERSLEYIRRIAKKYEVKQVLLFGSCLNKPEEEANDIDLAVWGLDDRKYFNMYEDLQFKTELGKKKVDLVYMESGAPITVIVEEEGVPIYDAGRD